MDLKSSKAVLEKYGQQHLLDYYGELGGDERKILLDEIGKLNFDAISEAVSGEGRKVGKLSSADALSLKEIAARADEYERAGLAAIRAGKVAAVLLAGGQGTRLGLNAPKGTFDIGVTRPLPIFGCLMNSLSAVAAKAGAYPLLFIMTSTLNDGQTKSFFKENGFFGYPEDRVCFYVQKTAPAISFDGKILLEEKYKPVLAPNGNGGWYASLRGSEYGKLLEKEGVEWLNVFGVDNVLQKICDPVFVGATIASGLACSGKVVKKAFPEEKVGMLCKEDGLPAIVEYYEMPDDLKTQRDDDGELKFRYGVILNYLFSVSKLDKVSVNKLPYHLAKKKVSFIEDGKKVVPEEPNAYKLETLAVDLVKLMGSCLAFEVEREREFAPVKNMTGVDSVDSARKLLEKNGVTL